MCSLAAHLIHLNKMAEKITFEEGDVVQLKSGGPAMTVIWSTDNEAQCRWFPTSAASTHGNFPNASLKKIDPPTEWVGLTS